MVSNPFSVKSPEGLEPEEIASLFVDVFTDFPKLQESGHTFLHGARGTGKSMMLRYLEPRVQIAAGHSSSVHELRYYAIHVPIKKANLSVPELRRMDGTVRSIIGEHLLCTHVASKIFESLCQVFSRIRGDQCAVEEFARAHFLPLCSHAGMTTDAGAFVNLAASQNPFDEMRVAMDDEFKSATQFLKRYAFKTERLPYEGSLTGFLDFLFPIASALKELPFMPNGPIYLMLDDADNLPDYTQRILNSWVATRTQNVISLKISTQLTYKTWRTADGTIISAPHDFTEIDIGTIYSNKTDRYYDRVREIARKRIMQLHPEEEIDPKFFFPENPKQKEAIDAMKNELKNRYDRGEGRGFRRADDVTRYAVPEYMRALAGSKKASDTFSYAGFSTLVYLSSGIVRWFLDAAAIMFSETKSALNIEAAEIKEIPPRIQDAVISEWSETFLSSELTKYQESDLPDDFTLERCSVGSPGEKLSVLINSLGEVFRLRLLDEHASERKLFSIVVSGKISRDTQEVLDRGIQWGYLQRSTIAAKTGVGRVPQYILSRRLAPYFKLDASGYAGYLPVTAEALEQACYDTRRFVSRRLKADRGGDAQQELPLGD